MIMICKNILYKKGLQPNHHPLLLPASGCTQTVVLPFFTAWCKAMKICTARTGWSDLRSSPFTLRDRSSHHATVLNRSGRILKRTGVCHPLSPTFGPEPQGVTKSHLRDEDSAREDHERASTRFQKFRCVDYPSPQNRRSGYHGMLYT